MASRPVPTRRAHRVLGRAVRRLVLLSAATLLLVAFGTYLGADRLAEDHALRTAEARVRTIADGIVGPLVTDGLREGDPEAFETLDRVVRNRIGDGSVLRVKVWTASGTVVYSDAPELVGRSFDLEPQDRALFGTVGTTSSVSTADRGENEFERDRGRLVEVYAGFWGADGSPLLFEAYLPGHLVTDERLLLLRDMLPLTLGSLVLLSMLLLPLAVSLSRQVERAERREVRALQTSIASSENERRRVAQDLHDGVIQDLAGIGYALSAVATPDGWPAEREGTRRQVEAIAEVVRRDVDALRALLTDIYPPDLRRGELLPALRQLVTRLRERGVATTLTVEPDLVLSPDGAALVYRVVREALRNVDKHAQARTASVRVCREDADIVVDVVDDGVGLQQGARTGHLGLQLLEDTLSDAGGELSVRGAVPGGVHLSARIPQ